MVDTIYPAAQYGTKKVQSKKHVQYFGAFDKKAWVPIFRKA
jgi:hypothetical protein